LSSGLWTPGAGAAAPSLDAFVAGIHRLIEKHTATHDAAQEHVQVELVGGERLSVTSISSEPGFGFITLSVEGDQMIVPVGSIRMITLGPADDEHKPGFALPQEKGPEPAA
jgi:hypothetical protein